jgi:hypothetical protein
VRQFRRPPYFGGWIDHNFVSMFTALTLDERNAHNLARSSFNAGIIDERSNHHWIETLDTAFGPA